MANLSTRHPAVMSMSCGKQYEQSNHHFYRPVAEMLGLANLQKTRRTDTSKVGGQTKTNAALTLTCKTSRSITCIRRTAPPNPTNQQHSLHANGRDSARSRSNFTMPVAFSGPEVHPTKLQVPHFASQAPNTGAQMRADPLHCEFHRESSKQSPKLAPHSTLASISRWHLSDPLSQHVGST